jgi:hypothetical protein
MAPLSCVKLKLMKQSENILIYEIDHFCFYVFCGLDICLLLTRRSRFKKTTGQDVLAHIILLWTVSFTEISLPSCSDIYSEMFIPTRKSQTDITVQFFGGVNNTENIVPINMKKKKA